MTPYTYCLYHIPTETYYYGCRYSKNCHPKDLWMTYFTSSKKVKNLIKDYTKDSFIVKKIKIHATKEKALSWETKFLKKVNAAKSKHWLNENNGDKKFYNKGHPHTTESKEKLRQKAIGRKRLPFTDEHINNMSDAHSGEKNHNYQNTKAIERCRLLGKNNKGLLEGEKNPSKRPEVREKQRIAALKRWENNRKHEHILNSRKSVISTIICFVQ